HLHKTEAARTAGLAIGNHLRSRHIPVLLEQGQQVVGGGIPRKVADVDILRHLKTLPKVNPHNPGPAIRGTSRCNCQPCVNKGSRALPKTARKWGESASQQAVVSARPFPRPCAVSGENAIMRNLYHRPASPQGRIHPPSRDLSGGTADTKE